MKILMVVTSHDQLGDSGRKTGLFLSELGHPYEVFKQGGFTVDIASPQGGKAPIDPISADAEDVQQFKQLPENTMKLSDVKTSDYAAAFIVGGHGAMFDLAVDNELHRILREMNEAKRPVAAVCHGQAGLVNARTSQGEFLIKNRKVTGFSNAEELQVGLSGAMPFSLQDILVERGAQYHSAAPWHEFVVADGNVFTGQNPASARRLAEAVVERVATTTA